MQHILNIPKYVYVVVVSGYKVHGSPRRIPRILIKTKATHKSVDFPHTIEHSCSKLYLGLPFYLSETIPFALESAL